MLQLLLLLYAQVLHKSVTVCVWCVNKYGETVTYWREWSALMLEITVLFMLQVENLNLHTV